MESQYLKPFLPDLEAVLEDPEVSELMINGPYNVWVERAGRLHPHEAPFAQCRRASSGQPFTSPGRSALIQPPVPSSMRVWRMAPGWPSACHRPAPGWPLRCGVSEAVRSRPRTWSGKALSPEQVLSTAREVLRSRRNILVSGGTGSGKTTLLNALIELLPDDERIVAIEDTLELRITAPTAFASKPGI